MNPEPDPSDGEIVVDGQRFRVRRRPAEPGVTEFTWFAHPHAYGFISASPDHSTPSRAEVEDAIRNFLSMIDPDAGYIEDE